MKKKAFTLVELMVVIMIIAMLIAILIPALIKRREGINKQEIIVVKVENDCAVANQNQPNKIELKPAFQGNNVELYLSNMPSNSKIIREDNMFYLLWTPPDRSTLNTIIITAAPNIKETRQITIFVK